MRRCVDTERCSCRVQTLLECQRLTQTTLEQLQYELINTVGRRLNLEIVLRTTATRHWDLCKEVIYDDDTITTTTTTSNTTVVHNIENKRTFDPYVPLTHTYL